MTARDVRTPPIGRKVSITSVPRPKRELMTGRYVSLVPLSINHADDLFDATRGTENDALWTYLWEGPFKDRKIFTEYIVEKSQSEDPLYFAVVHNTTSKAIGHVSLMAIEPSHRSIMVGHVLFSPKLQRTPGATEAIYLLARTSFDELKYRRLEWRCDDLNIPSKNAAIRLGFTLEGLFRQHMIIKGHNRDTAWYAMVDTDWPVLKTGFEAWLEPSNYDEEGRQRSGLAKMRAAAKPSQDGHRESLSNYTPVV